jgi:hypothetical protein
MPIRPSGAKPQSLRSGAIPVTTGALPLGPDYPRSRPAQGQLNRTPVRRRPRGPLAPPQTAARAGHRSPIARLSSGHPVGTPRSSVAGPEPDALASDRLLALVRMAASLARTPLKDLGRDEASLWVNP